MKDYFDNINKVFENRVRLAVMSLLMVNPGLDFNTLKEKLNLTDGNLSSHASTLEKHGYLEIKKEFVGKKPLTTYRASEKGKEAFKKHLDALEKIIRGNL